MDGTSFTLGRFDFDPSLSTSFHFLSSEFALGRHRLQISGELFQTWHLQGE